MVQFAQPYIKLNDPAFQKASEIGLYRFEDYHGLPSIAEQIPSVQALSKDEAEFEASQPGQQIITIDIDTLDRIKDTPIEFQVVLPKEDVQAYMVANMSSTKKESASPSETSDPPAERPTPTEDTIRSRMATLTYSNAQIAEATFAMADRLSEQQILEWFRPEIPPAEMARLRMQQTPSPEKTSVHSR